MAAAASEESAGPEIRTQAGVVRGRREHGLAVFRGIPFAQPPVGAARFQAPQPVQPWDGVRDAADFGPPAPQEHGFMGRTGGPEPQFPEGDGWLTVNVWTPAPDPGARLPVMVWIYGGAYKLGFSGSPGYDARHIVRDGNVVVVSFNYRLGIEGFVQLDGAPANRGLLDMVAALEWVRDNVAAFGGDADQVTVFGESAGAGAIAALLAMPRAAGLFRRAVVQSMAGIYFTPELGRDIATAIAAERGLRPTVADLAGTDPRELPAAGADLGAAMLKYADRWGPVAHSLSPFAPVVDGDVLPSAPWEALRAGSACDVELVIGHNRDECRLFTALGGRLGTITDEQASVALRVFGPAPDPERAYRAAFPEATAGGLHEIVQSDWLFRMPALHLAEAQAAAGGRAHLYELTFSAPAHDGALGACHGLDGPLIFGTLDAHLGPLLFGPTPSPDVQTLSSRIHTAWTTFATTGDPGWPAYTPEQRLTHLFDTTSSVAPYPEEQSRHLWQAHHFGALDLVDG